MSEKASFIFGSFLGRGPVLTPGRGLFGAVLGNRVGPTNSTLWKVCVEFEVGGADGYRVTWIPHVQTYTQRLGAFIVEIPYSSHCGHVVCRCLDVMH